MNESLQFFFEYIFLISYFRSIETKNGNEVIVFIQQVQDLYNSLFIIVNKDFHKEKFYLITFDQSFS